MEEQFAARSSLDLEEFEKYDMLAQYDLQNKRKCGEIKVGKLPNFLIFKTNNKVGNFAHLEKACQNSSSVV